MAGQVTVKLDRGEIQGLLTAPAGPVGAHMEAVGGAGAAEAQRRAPVSPDGSHGRRSGYLRSKIDWKLGRDGKGLYVDIRSTALTRDGKPYPLWVETGTSSMEAQPYLRPALDAIMRRR